MGLPASDLASTNVKSIRFVDVELLTVSNEAGLPRVALARKL